MKNSDRYISPRRIAGLITFGLAVIFSAIGILLNANPETYLPNNMYPGYTFGGIGIILLLLSVNDPKTKKEYIARKEARQNAKIAQKEARSKKLVTENDYVREYYETHPSNFSESKYHPEPIYQTQPAYKDVSSIDGMDGHEFEYFCADLLRKNGFSNVNVTRGSGDQGVDILAVNGGIRYAIQCKNYASHLGNKPIQEVHAGKTFYNCHVGVVMTNSTFTPAAKELANATGVLTWDRSVLQRMMNSL